MAHAFALNDGTGATVCTLYIAEGVEVPEQLPGVFTTDGWTDTIRLVGPGDVTGVVVDIDSDA